MRKLGFFPRIETTWICCACAKMWRRSDKKDRIGGREIIGRDRRYKWSRRLSRLLTKDKWPGVRKRGSGALERANCRVCVVSNSAYRKSSTRLFLLSTRWLVYHWIMIQRWLTGGGGYISRGSLCEDAAAVAVPVHPALVSWIVRLHD